jgi:hypothetical protein
LDEYWDPSVTAPPPFYSQEEVQVFDRFFIAGEEFGAGLGSGTGPETAIASSLASALSRVEGLKAAAVGDTVYVASTRPDQYLPIKASNDMGVALVGYNFQVQGSGGEVLTVAPRDRRTYYLIKKVRTQAPPGILP